ncbi:hypothetical protein [Protaetiibacter intestinalis]|uniref:Uncharacterized protein n=1 Tax=Protaetiibacter intestinalis TaxID=2419774 RepID=A0A387BA18_9MICO|nr:hypothetical protein [Protaetiibacter intestinalis]AYF97995.1 hypothetical protein D7I47_06825 [Protaetiibacter intestinalis]
MRGVGVGGLLVAVLFGAAGCAPSPAPALPDGVQVQLVQLRSDVADRTAQVRVVNGSDADLVVERLVVEDDWFAGPAEREKRSAIAAGRTVDLRIQLPESACEGEPAAGERRSRALLELAGIGTVEVDLVDPLGFSVRLHERECLAHDAAAVAGIRISGFVASPAGEPARLELAIEPTGGDGAIELLELRPTNLLQFTTAESSPHPLGVTVAGSDAPQTLQIPLVPQRCDPHAVMEDKRGTVFGLSLRADGVEGVVDVAASDELKGRMLRWVADWCGYA